MAAQDAVARIVRDLRDVVEQHHGRLTTGLFATKYLVRVLCQYGRPDLAAPKTPHRT